MPSSGPRHRSTSTRRSRPAGESLTVGGPDPATDLSPPAAVADAGGSGSAGLTGQVARGAAWVSLSRLGGQLLQFATSLVLAHFLAPRDFGVFVSVTVITSFAQIFFDFGMSGALVQLEELREEDLSTVFWLSAIGGVVFAALMLAIGPLLASFFGSAQIATVAPLVALCFTLHLAVCHQALLERALRFGRLTIIELAANGLGFAASIGLAVAGAGVYALALGPVVTTLTGTLGCWIAVRWRPHTFIHRSSLRRIWRFSSGLVGFQIVDYWSANLDNALVGRFAGPAPLGLYNRAFNFMQIPVLQVGWVLGRVFFPALSLMRDDPVRAARAYARALTVVGAIVLPTLAGIAVVAPGLVPTLWGQQWVGMVPLLILLSLAGMPLAIASSTSWVYQALNRTDVQFRVGVVTALVGVVAMVIGIHWGARGVAWAVLIRSWVMFLPQMRAVSRVVGLPMSALVGSHGGAVVATGAMAAATAYLPVLLGWDRADAATLLAQVILGAVVYAGVSAVSQRGVIAELRALIRRRASRA